MLFKEHRNDISSQAYEMKIKNNYADILHLAIRKMLLANSENLTPQPPSLQGKGEPDSPLLLGEGLDPSSIRQQYLRNRG